MSQLLSFRRLLIFALLLAFLWQTKIALKKFLKKSLSISVEEEPSMNLVFPSVSLCPILVNRSFGYDNPFAATPMIPFIYAYEHGESVDFTLMKDHFKALESNDNVLSNVSAASQWKKVVRIGQNIRNVQKLMECLTYEPDRTFDGGATKSKLGIYLDSKKYLYLFVYIHETLQDILVPTPLYGTEFLQVPQKQSPNDSNFTRMTYMITPEVNYKLPRENLPCYEGDMPTDISPHLLSCIEGNFENGEGCSLPWNEKNHNHTCQSKAEYNHFHKHFMTLYDAGPEELYNKTNCYFKCQYQSFVLEKMNTVLVPKELVNVSSSSDYGLFDTCLRLYLSPAGVLHKHEVLIYDVGDLVGDIGGFLGLFLGASIVSVYDEIIQGFKRRFRKISFTSDDVSTIKEKNITV